MSLTNPPQQGESSDKPKITSQDDKELWATYKGAEIEILKEDDGYYIIVTHEDGGYCYDGYWGDNEATFDDALTEAIKGSLL